MQNLFFSIDKNNQSKQKKYISWSFFFMPFYATKNFGTLRSSCILRPLMGSDICHLKGLDAKKPEGYVKSSEKILFWSKAPSKFTFFYIFQNLVFVLNPLFFIQYSCRFEHKYSEEKTIWLIAHFKILVTCSANTENDLYKKQGQKVVLKNIS